MSDQPDLKELSNPIQVTRPTNPSTVGKEKKGMSRVARHLFMEF